MCRLVLGLSFQEDKLEKSFLRFLFMSPSRLYVCDRGRGGVPLSRDECVRMSG
jgi:hypothetical protein